LNNATLDELQNITCCSNYRRYYILLVVKFFLINSSENFSPRPNAHKVSIYRVVTGKKKKSKIGS
jgi:hypothetical protein